MASTRCWPTEPRMALDCIPRELGRASSKRGVAPWEPNPWVAAKPVPPTTASGGGGHARNRNARGLSGGRGHEPLLRGREHVPIGQRRGAFRTSAPRRLLHSRLVQPEGAQHTGCAGTVAVEHQCHRTSLRRPVGAVRGGGNFAVARLGLPGCRVQYSMTFSKIFRQPPRPGRETTYHGVIVEPWISKGAAS